jgi:hypothetical protein
LSEERGERKMERDYREKLSFVILIIWLIMTLLAIPVSAGDAVEIGNKIYCLEEGDLLFYNGGSGHIGMYSGNGKFVDAHPGNTPGVKKDQPIENSRFDTSATQCYSVKTTQAKRNAAVTWAEGKHGKVYSLLPSTPCDAGDEWYCSELVHCAYKEQSITLGEIDFLGYVTPQSITTDSDVESVSHECPAGSPNSGTYYVPGTIEDGCCQYGSECYDGNKDPVECTCCYDGNWHSGWWCEDSECVPEASTFVLFAVGLLCMAGYLGLRRKEK